jgi:hypothetical protein
MMAQLITIANHQWTSYGILQGTSYESLQAVSPPNPVTSVACDGNGTYIAIRQNTANVYKSTDHLETLTPVSLQNNPFVYHNIYYFGGKFVICGIDNGYWYCYYSSDGDSWSRAQIHSGQFHVSDGFEPLGSYMVLYGDTGQDATKDVYYSSDLITWSSVNVHTANNDPVSPGGSFGNGRYLIRYESSDARVYRATAINGSYSNIAPSGLSSINGIRYGNSKFLLLDWVGDKLYSSATGDSGSWSEITYNASFPIFDRYAMLHFDAVNNLFVVIRGNKSVHTSADGITWVDCLASPGVIDSDYFSSIAISDYPDPPQDRWRNYVRSAERNI